MYQEAAGCGSAGDRIGGTGGRCGGPGRRRRRHLTFQLGNLAGELLISRRQCERPPQVDERVRLAAGPQADLAEAAPRRQVFRRGMEHGSQLTARGVQIAQREQRATEGHARGMVFGVMSESGPADADGVLMAAGAPVFLGELREGKRRRVPLDPASQFLQPRWISHPWECTSQPEGAG